MRVYTRVVCRWDEREQRYVTVEEESYDHHGPVAECKGASKQKESEQSKALAEVGAKEWNRYQQEGVPFRNRYMALVDSLNTAPARENAVGNAMKSAQVSAPRISAGSETGTGAMLAGLGAVEQATQGAATEAGTTADAGVDEAAIAGQQALISQGRNQSVQTSARMQREASQAEAEERADTLSRLQERGATLGAVGTLAGAAGYGAYQKWGTGTKKPLVPKGTTAVGEPGGLDTMYVRLPGG